MCEPIRIVSSGSGAGGAVVGVVAIGAVSAAVARITLLDVVVAVASTGATITAVILAIWWVTTRRRSAPAGGRCECCGIGRQDPAPRPAPVPRSPRGRPSRVTTPQVARGAEQVTITVVPERKAITAARQALPQRVDRAAIRGALRVITTGKR